MTNRFHAHDIALEWAAALGPALRRIAQRDPNLGRQMRRAVASVPLNLAEGACRAGKDRMHHYRIAAGSAAEAQSGLRLALGWGHLEAGELGSAEALADRLRAMLWRLTQPGGEGPCSFTCPCTVDRVPCTVGRVPGSVFRSRVPWPSTVVRG